MKKAHLLKTQRNEVFDILKEFDLGPPEFEWKEEVAEPFPMRPESAIVSKLTHEQTGFFFTFDLRDTPFLMRYSPGLEMPEVYEPCDNWERVQLHLRLWGACLKRELDAPDLWATIAAQKPIPSDASTAENTPLTGEEKKRLTAAVSEIEDEFSTAREFSSQEKQFLTNEFAYLREAVERQGKKDWLHTAVGVIVGAIITLTLSDKAKVLWEFACQQIHSALQLAIEGGGKLLT